MKCKGIKCVACAALLLPLLIACSAKGEKGQALPKSKGLPFELVMIIPEQIYGGELRDTLESVLLGSTPVLPQHEPMFRLNVVYSDGNLTPWRTFRNRLIVRVNRRSERPSMGMAVDVMARPQIEVKVEAASAHELAVFIGQHRERLCDLFVENELEVGAATLRGKYSKATALALQRLTTSMVERGLLSGKARTICMPVGLKASKEGTDFLWTGTNLNDKDQNFVFYTYPWDGRPLSDGQFVAKRDSVLRANIPGSRPDQWMQTARSSGGEGLEGEGAGHDIPLILSRTRTINNKVVQEVHGLWELHHGALGGPFVSLVRIDTAACRVVVTEGFVYSPHSPKRNLMRELEAALRTFK